MRNQSSDKAVILVVEGENEARERLRNWLFASGYEPRVAANGVEALGLLKSQPIDVAITDLKIPGLHGIDLLELIKDFDPEIEVVILAGSATLEDAVRAIRGRAFEFLQKPLTDLPLLNKAIEKALLQRRRHAPVLAPGASHALAERKDFSPRELAIMDLLATGSDNREIAARLGLSVKTVRNLMAVVFAKLGVLNRAQAIVSCRQLSSN